MIDATYRTLPDRTHRAIAGLSMGAGQAHPPASPTWTSFAYIGASAAAPKLRPQNLLQRSPL